MSLDPKRDNRVVKVFIAVSVLILAQVGWWTIIFIRDVDIIAQLRKENLRLSHPSALVSGEGEIERAALHRRFMFISESVTFGILTAVGLYLLVHAIRSEQRSRDIQRNFVEVVTHESKTPLTALKLRLESLLEKRRQDPEMQKGLTQALTEVRRLSSTLEKVLNWNRLERHAYRFEPFDLSLAVDEVVRRLEPFFEENGAVCKLELDADTMIEGDISGIQSSLQALLENAVLYNEKKDKEVVLKLKRGLETVAIIVEDNGPGVPLEERERIFERFYRGRAGRRVPGTGLGLQIARRIVEAHKGVIQYRANSIGSAFEVILPAGGLA